MINAKSTRQPRDGDPKTTASGRSVRLAPRPVRVKELADGFQNLAGLRRSADLRRRIAASRTFASHAVAGRCVVAAHARNYPQSADRLLGHGHGDRGAARHRHGAGGGHRRHPPEFFARRSGGGGAQGQALRERHGGRSDHHLPRRDARRRARPDGGPWHFRHSRRRTRRLGQGGQARRHSHQPRRALRPGQAPVGRRADDQEAHHRPRGRRPGGGASACCIGIASRSCWSWTRIIAASASSR